jgi:pilus assembly protein CpaE
MSTDPILVVEESSVLSDLIRDLLEATGFAVVQASTSRDGIALAEEDSFSCILVDHDMPAISGPAIIQEIRSGDPPSEVPILLLIGEDPESLPTGIRKADLVHKPIDPVELITRVRAAVGGVAPSKQASPASSDEDVDEGEEEDAVPKVKLSRTPGQGKIITVFSLKGGVGASTIAVNVAVALQQMWDDSTALVDLSLESGALNILLDIMPTSTVDELAQQNGNMTAEMVVQYLVAHKSGVSLLSAPPSPERAELIDGAALRKAVGFLREQFDYVVIDTASTFAEHTLMALELADHIILPLIGDISSIRATTTALDIFGALSIPDEKVVLVFNEIFPKMGLSRKHAETSMNVTMMPLPYGGAKLVDSINLGNPIVLSDPEGPFSEAIGEIAVKVSHPDGELRPKKTGALFSKMRKRLGA